MCPTWHGRGVDEAVVLSPDRGRWLGMQCITETLVLYFGGLRLGFAIPPIDFKPRTPEGTHIRLSPRILRGINGDFDAEAKTIHTFANSSHRLQAISVGREDDTAIPPDSRRYTWGFRPRDIKQPLLCNFSPSPTNHICRRDGRYGCPPNLDGY